MVLQMKQVILLPLQSQQSPPKPCITLEIRDLGYLLTQTWEVICWETRAAFCWEGQMFVFQRMWLCVPVVVVALMSLDWLRVLFSDSECIRPWCFCPCDNCRSINTFSKYIYIYIWYVLFSALYLWRLLSGGSLSWFITLLSGFNSVPKLVLRSVAFCCC